VKRTLARRRKTHSKAPKLTLVKNSRGSRKTALSQKPQLVCVAEGAQFELPAAQQEALVMKYRIKARKLGRSILRRWNARLDLDEVDSIVDLSLCEAVTRFDPRRGAGFMTFLFYHLKGNLVRAVTVAAANSSTMLAFAELIEGHGFECEEAIRSNNSGISALEIAEAVSSQEAPAPDEALWRKELQGRSAEACEKLDDLEREIVKRIFVHEQQIIDIAASLGYSRCHVSRVKKKALDTLHDELLLVMNHDDCSLMAEERVENLDDIHSRVSSRKEIHRRRPRSQHSSRQDAEAAKAA
jgi:RNA polymerase sigma factor for flagellar operon FliA